MFSKILERLMYNRLDKLYMYGIRGIAHDWFLSYLSNRLQAVLYNNHESDFKAMKCGIPQGSILGHLVILIYINDLPSVSHLFIPTLFAGDTNLICTGNNLKDVVSQINVEKDKVYCWVKPTNYLLALTKRISCYSHLNMFHVIWLMKPNF